MKPTTDDVTAWEGASEAAAPLAAARAATLTIDTSGFAGTATAARMSAILADARERLGDGKPDSLC